MNVANEGAKQTHRDDSLYRLDRAYRVDVLIVACRVAREPAPRTQFRKCRPILRASAWLGHHRRRIASTTPSNSRPDSDNGPTTPPRGHKSPR